MVVGGAVAPSPCFFPLAFSVEIKHLSHARTKRDPTVKWCNGRTRPNIFVVGGEVAHCYAAEASGSPPRRQAVTILRASASRQ